MSISKNIIEAYIVDEEAIFATAEEVRSYIEGKDDFAEAAEEWLEEALDEEEPIYIGSLVYSVSEVLRKVDPIAWRCEASDYADSLLSDLVYDLNRLADEDDLAFYGYGIRKTAAYCEDGKLVEYIQ